jgi:uncharacterized protein
MTNFFARLLLVACALPCTLHAQPATAGSGRDDIVPAADHHVHLLGPYALPLPDALPAEVKLPEDLTQLLAARAALAGNVKTEADFANVFTSDAQLLDAYINPTGWMRSRMWFMRYINLLPPSTRRRYVPNAYDMNGTLGYIAGTILDVPSEYHVENFSIAVKKGADGRWRITSEAATPTTPPRYATPITAARLIADLDEAGIKRALVLSEAFWLGEPGGPRRLSPAPSPREAVQLENDWAAAEVAKYPDRLVMACGINPLRDFAVDELVRCSKLPHVVGMKMNFGDAGVDFVNAGHMTRLKQLFEAANANRMALIIHLEPGRFYGPKEVEYFLDHLVSAAPDVTIQIAHLAGNGPGVTSPEALEAFAKLRAANDPRTKNLYFDFAGLIPPGISDGQLALMATRMRQLGLDRVLFASDALPRTNANPSAAQQWSEARRRLPLTDAELRVVAGNVAPYMVRLTKDER